MDCPDDVSFMTSFLRDFNYPLIHSMNFEEVANVFHISNRCFLVCWTLTILDEKCYLEVLKDREHDKDLLGNLVAQHGFCTSKEKPGFLNGDLSVDRQFQIIRKMFTCINRLKKAESLENQLPVTLDDLHMLIKTNLNIFPTFGEIVILSDKEKINKIRKLQKEIEQLKLFPENSTTTKQNACRNVCRVDKSELKNTVAKLSENFSQFDRIMKAISKEQSYKIKSDYKIDPRSEELLINCNKYLKVLSQYTEDLKMISTFKIEDIPTLHDEVSPLIKILAEQVQNIIRSI